MATPLATPLLDLGIENPNFFEGRLLTAAALRADQEANRARQRQLGRAIGAGVVEGLWVTLVADGADGSTPLVSVTGGLAFNRRGQALEIAKEREEIALTAAIEADGRADAGLFHTCSPPSDQVAATGEGIYVLVLSPASGYGDDLAPMSGFGTGAIGAGCGRRSAVEGVQLHLVALNPLNVSGLDKATEDLLRFELLGATDPARLSRLRNVLAHLCFGSAELARWPADPFATADGTPALAAYGALDDLRDGGRLTECDVPLALLDWTLSGVQFVDNWSVRRCPSPPACSDDWPTLSGGRRRREAEAGLYQFQEHLAWLGERVESRSTVEARKYFDHLPSAGLVPVRGPGSAAGWTTGTFFAGLVTGGPTEISGNQLVPLLRRSASCGPVDLGRAPSLQLYQVEENLAEDSRQRYVAFTSRALHGPIERDGVALSFGRAWTVYGGLVRRRVFQPSETDGDALGARFTILSALQEVRTVALREGTLAAGRHLDREAALGAFERLHSAQSELARTFAAPIPGIVDTQDREDFAATLSTYLDEAVPDRLPSLASAIAARDLPAAVAAQNAINHFVGTWSGDGVAIGFIRVRHHSSPRGVEMKAGDDRPYPHLFTVTNNTDRLLTNIELRATVTGAGVDWDGAIRILDSAGREGREIDHVALPSTGSRDVVVEVTVSADAEIGEQAVVSVAASVGPPHDKRDRTELVTTITEEAGAPVTHSVTFDRITAPSDGDLDDVSEGERLTFGFDLLFSASQEPTEATFDFRVTLDADPDPTLGEWLVDFVGRERVDEGDGTFSTPVPLRDGMVLRRLLVRLRAPRARGAEDKIVILRARPVARGLELESPEAGPFTVRLRRAG